MPWRFGILLSIFSLTLVVIFAFALTRDSLARYVWHNYSNAALAQVLNSSDPNLALELGRYYFGGGEYNLARAKASYQLALSIDPELLWGHYALSRIYFVEGNFEKALEAINKELETHPENLRSLYVRGLVYGYREYPGDLEKAEEDFQRFTAWAPREWAGYNDLAWILLKQKKNDEVVRLVEDAFQNIPNARENNPWLWNVRGVAELNRGSKTNAVESLEQALSIAKRMPLSTWQEAYPGNEPADAAMGFEAFKAAIAENLKKAQL